MQKQAKRTVMPPPVDGTSQLIIKTIATIGKVAYIRRMPSPVGEKAFY
jgi:hypothetical protein